MKYELWAPHWIDTRLIPKGSILKRVDAKENKWEVQEPSSRSTYQIVWQNGPVPSASMKPLDADATAEFKKKHPNAKIDAPPPPPLSSLKIKGPVGDVPDMPKAG